MLVSELIDQVLMLVNQPDRSMLGDPRVVVMNAISQIQRDFATRTGKYVKRCFCYSAATGGERTQQESTLSSIGTYCPYEYVGVKAVQYDGKPMPLKTYKTYLADYNNAGGALYGDPRYCYIYNNTVHLWPIPSESKVLRVFISAKPKDIVAETETLEITDAAIRDGAVAIVKQALKDYDGSAVAGRSYVAAVNREIEAQIEEDGEQAPFADIDQRSGYVDSNYGRLFI